MSILTLTKVLVQQIGKVLLEAITPLCPVRHAVLGTNLKGCLL